MPLTNTQVKNLKAKKKVIRTLDGNGLYIEVAVSGTKTWIHRYSFNKKSTMRVLGHYDDMSLEDARIELIDDKKLLRKGANPRDTKGKNANKNLAPISSFESVFNEWYEVRRKSLSKEYVKDIAERANNYLFPYIGAISINQISTPDMIRILKKMDDKGVLDTLSKVRGIASMVFGYAIGVGLIDRNPTTDIPKNIFTPKKKKHYSFTSKPEELGEILRSIDSDKGTYQVNAALNLLPHVFLRPVELCGLSWDEVDFENRILRVKAERMKMEKEHIVPMSNQVYLTFKYLRTIDSNSHYVFPSPSDKNKHISTNSIRLLLRKSGVEKDKLTPHGFRHTASTLLNELGYRPDIIERQLSHADNNSIRDAYNKAYYLNERKKMMQEYSDFLDKQKKT